MGIAQPIRPLVIGGVVDRFNQAIAQIENRSEEGMMELALEIKANALERTPIDTGNLRASCALTPPFRLPAGIGIIIYYGAEYAPPVHENLEAHHPVGEAKYLERAIEDIEPRAPEILLRTAKI